MSKDTKIQWCDSSLNLQMGCDGCELWTKERKICYAGTQTQERAGFPGWPKRFEDPVLFLDRLDAALKWKDLSGTKRPDKPWLDDYPRLIFLNDMGDTFSKKLPLDWMAPLLPRMAVSPHQFLVLTKRPSRAAEFSRSHPFPANFWIGTSVTEERTASRVAQLREVQSCGPKFVSFEPMWETASAESFDGIQWAVFGGESGAKGATPTMLDHLMTGVKHARNAGVAPFVKQLGSRPFFRTFSIGKADPRDPIIPYPIFDSHGGDWNEWPTALRVREMPKINMQTSLL